MTFELVQVVRGEACTDAFGADAAECAGDSAGAIGPTATVTMTSTDVDTSVIHIDIDAEPPGFMSLRVPASEFVALAAGADPSNGAPDGFTWTKWPVAILIQDGRIVAAHQQFQS